MRFTLYRDGKRQWRWRLVASNGRTLADSGESYKRKIDAVSAVSRVQRGAAGADFVVSE